MELTKFERIQLINQFKILEKLYPEEAKYYSEHRQALQEGYQLHYKWIFDGLWEEMDEEQCKEVLNILDMYRAITDSYNRLDDKTGIEGQYWLKFKGFDGNNESHLMSYCQYFIIDLQRYEELTYGAEFPDFNSHMPSIEKYRKMLEVWNSLNVKNHLPVNTLKNILEA
jgi:hypothetical protein